MAIRLRRADQATLFVANIDYNARGERQRITYATMDGANFAAVYEYGSGISEAEPIDHDYGIATAASCKT
jgi:hypothetical protein